MTYSLQHEVFLANCYCVINFVTACTNGKLNTTVTEKLTFEYDKSFSGTTTNLRQQNPCITSEIIFVTNLYCTIYYLVYQEFLTVCAYP